MSERLTVSPRTYRMLAVAALALLATIVVTGAAVRLTGSGLGCSDWPNCEEGEFLAASTPNQAIEQVNRLFTGLVSLSVIAAVLGSLRRRPYRRDLVWLSLGLVVGVIGQIVLGGITVLVDLHPLAVAGHFVLSMVLVSNAVVLVWRAGRPAGPRRVVVDRTDLRLSRSAVLLACALMLSGPLVTGSGPHAGDAASPRFGWAIPDVVRIHSINMWIFLVVLIVLMVRLARNPHTARAGDERILRRGTTVLSVVVAQGGIGYLQYELGIPAWLVLLHIVGATLVLSSTVWFHLGLSAPVVADEEQVVPPAVDDALRRTGVSAEAFR
jgi:cytochrome c oxidase assembly protein subunit 15